MARYSLKYNGSTVHVSGAAIRSSSSGFNFTSTACPALTRSFNFCERGAKATTAAEVIKEARALAFALGSKRLCKFCMDALEAEAAADAQAAPQVAAAPAGRQLRPAQGESVLGGVWELLYDKPRQGCQVVRGQGVYALACVKHLTVHRLGRLSDERAARKAGGWCPDCQH
jgi:hypothetical protein